MHNKDFEEYIKTKEDPVGYYQVAEFKDADFIMTIIGDGMREKYCSGDRIAIYPFYYNDCIGEISSRLYRYKRPSLHLPH